MGTDGVHRCISLPNLGPGVFLFLSFCCEKKEYPILIAGYTLLDIIQANNSSLLHGCVSQGLGTTEFTNLIG